MRLWSILENNIFGNDTCKNFEVKISKFDLSPSFDLNNPEGLIWEFQKNILEQFSFSHWCLKNRFCILTIFSLLLTHHRRFSLVYHLPDPYKNCSSLTADFLIKIWEAKNKKFSNLLGRTKHLKSADFSTLKFQVLIVRLS